MEKKQYKYLDTFRAILCIAVLLYHLGLLQGGFLAVCSFFVLSGYLTTKSFLNKEKVDLKKHYVSRIKRVYLPLAVVVFASVAIVALQPEIVWVSLKPETSSVLFGYNNFWQIEANLDYFARHTTSPFTHLWYMAILMQFELIYPILFVVLQKTRKLNFHLPTIISSLLTIGFTVWFVVYSKQAPISAVYYNTFARVFSLFMGVNACFIHHSLDRNLFLKENVNKLIYFGCNIALIVLFFVLSAENEGYAIAMIVTSLMSCLIIECAIGIDVSSMNLFDKICKVISNISYEVYLVQYPVIYFYQIFAVNQEDIYMNAFVISLITLVISITIHFALFKKAPKTKLQMILSVLLLFVSLFGGYEYVMAKDHTEEMKQLEAELAAQAEDMEKQNAEYEEKLKQENNAWEELLAQLEPNEEEIRKSISQLPIVCIGDSVMLGAAPNIRGTFGNGYVDAKVSRTGYVMPDILKALKIKGPVVIHAGTNGDCPESIKDRIMKYCGDNDVFWLTVTNDKDVKVNDKLKEFVNKYENAYIIDWQQYSKDHKDWFYSDKIHLTSEGRKGYVSLIFDSIYQVKLKELEDIRDSAIAERENELKKKISFVGNDLLTGVYNQLNASYVDASFIADKDLNAETLLSQLESSNQQEMLNYNVVLVLDASFEMNKETFMKIKNICKNKNLRIITTVRYDELNDECIISFEEILDANPSYYRPDRVRLNEQGNEELHKFIVDILSAEE